MDQTVSEKKKIEITISGYTGSGKSTLAAYISKSLRNAGFQVSVDDIDLNFSEDPIDFCSEERVTAIKSSTDVSIATHQKLK